MAEKNLTFQEGEYKHHIVPTNAMSQLKLQQ